MKVKKLINILLTMPMDAQVWHLWDGEARTEIKYVWLAKNGKVITADSGMLCYSTKTRPSSAPTKEQQKHWTTPDNIK